MRPYESMFRIIGMVLAVLGSACGAPVAGSRRVHVGDPVPDLSIVDVKGQAYTHARASGKVLIVTFLSAEQRYCVKARADLEKIIGELGSRSRDVDLVVSTDDPNTFRSLTVGDNRFTGRLVLTLDRDHEVWGKFGAIAFPTVVICGTNGKVHWVEAGYSYDFAPVVRARLNQALGIAQTVPPDTAGVVQIASRDTVESHVKRLIQAADLMSGKGHLESAIAELEKARQLDPNAVAVLTRLGEFYCRSGKGLAALQVLAKTEGRNQAEQGRLSLIQGWAYRQVGDMEKAEEALLRAVELDPRSARSFFELGRVYEKQGRIDKAMEAYRKASAIMLGEA